MKSTEPNEGASHSDERILRAVRRQQNWLRGLTVLAVVFWVLTVLGSISILALYSVFYAPKEKQMFSDYEKYGHLTRYTNSATGSLPAGPADLQQALGVHFIMNYVATKGILAMVFITIILSCGTLTTLLLVVLNRRVTLKQINHSLAQISDQLRALQRPASDQRTESSRGAS